MSFRVREWSWWGPSNLPRLQLRELPRCSLQAEQGGKMGHGCGAPSVPEPRGPGSLLGAAASLCTLSPCPQPASCHHGVGGDRATTGIIRNPSKITLSRSRELQLVPAAGPRCSCGCCGQRMCHRSVTAVVGQESPAKEHCWRWVGGWVGKSPCPPVPGSDPHKRQQLLPCLPRAASSGKPWQLWDSNGEPFSFRCCWGSLQPT